MYDVHKIRGLFDHLIPSVNTFCVLFVCKFGIYFDTPSSFCSEVMYGSPYGKRRIGMEKKEGRIDALDHKCVPTGRFFGHPLTDALFYSHIAGLGRVGSIR